LFGFSVRLSALRTKSFRISGSTWVGGVFVRLLLVLAALLYCGRGAEGRRRRWNVYQNKAFDFRFLAPKGWDINDQRTHPSIVVNLRSPEGADVSVGVRVMVARITLMAFARSEVQVIKALGFPVSDLEEDKVGSQDALMVFGEHPKKKTDYVFYFFQKGRVGFVLMFTYPRDKGEPLKKLFELVLRSFKFT